jgi:hypothetical protein
MEGVNIQGNFKRMRSDDGERKIPRKIFGPIKDNYVWRIRTNHDLIDLQRESDIFRNQKSKTTMVRTCGKNIRRKYCEECSSVSQKEKGQFQRQEVVVEHYRK